MRTYVIILMRACTHGGWAHGQRISTTFLPGEKLSQFFRVLLRGSNLGFSGLESVALPIEPPRVRVCISVCLSPSLEREGGEIERERGGEREIEGGREGERERER